jgi:hypothetical protein
MHVTDAPSQAEAAELLRRALQSIEQFAARATQRGRRRPEATLELRAELDALRAQVCSIERHL